MFSFSSKVFDTQVAGVCVCWTPASGVLHTLSLGPFSLASRFCPAGAGVVHSIGIFSSPGFFGSPPRASLPTVTFASPANDPCATGACLFSPTTSAGACLVSTTSNFEFFRLIILCHGSSVAGLLCSTARAHGDANDLASQAPCFAVYPTIATPALSSTILMRYSHLGWNLRWRIVAKSMA